MEALLRLTTGRTTLIIAHRLATVAQADRILVLDQGRIAQAGTHSQLLAQRGRYLDLWQCAGGVAAVKFPAGGVS